MRRFGKWIARAGLAQGIAWLTFALAITFIGVPLWVPSPITLFLLAQKGG